MKEKTKKEKRRGRHSRVRAKIFGTRTRPRLCVFRSAKHIYGQLIDDEKGKTIVSVNDNEIKRSTKRKAEEKAMSGKIAIAFGVGKLIAEKAAKEKIEKVVFDRGGYEYHGRVKSLAEGAREGGLKF